jgi:hypothetical protein
LLTHPTLDALTALRLEGMAFVGRSFHWKARLPSSPFAELIADDRGRSLDPVAWIGLMLDREQAWATAPAASSRACAQPTSPQRSARGAICGASSRACAQPTSATATPAWRMRTTGRPAASTGRCSRASAAPSGSTGTVRHRSPGPLAIVPEPMARSGSPWASPGWPARSAMPPAAAFRTVLHHRLPRLFSDLELARGDGRFDRLFRKIARVDLLILDDWGPDRLTATQRRDLMEIVEERYGRRSTIVTSQLPVETWHEVIGEPTFADAILDRVRAFARTNGAHALTSQRLPHRPGWTVAAQDRRRRPA